MPSRSDRLDDLAEGERGAGPLLDEVRKFHEASLRGDFYESFDVNSRNFMDKSEGTEAFIACAVRATTARSTRVRSRGHAAGVAARRAPSHNGAVMRHLIEEHHRLEAELHRLRLARDLGDPEVSPDAEDRLLDEMEAIWHQITPEDQRLLEAECAARAGRARPA